MRGRSRQLSAKGIWYRATWGCRAEELPQWMIELAEQIKLIPPATELVRGVIVGSAVIERCGVLAGLVILMPRSARDQPEYFDDTQ
jgi:hypothetical protein